MDKIQAIKGTNDILTGDIGIWQLIERVIREKMRVFGYGEIRTPVFEATSLFARSIGKDTDIVGKEMYTFEDMGRRSLTLRPEGTASVVRSFIEHSLDQRGLPQKLWYMGPMFRQERPQKGRQRQFHQFGVEVIGSSSPLVDAEVMQLFDCIAGDLGIVDRVYAINCLGGSESRAAYRDALVGYLDTVEALVCPDCRRRKLTNPLRVLDCKVPGCREVFDVSRGLPKTIDYLVDSDRAEFDRVMSYLETIGIRYTVDYSLVRGLDYYTGTVFEMNCAGLGSQSTVVGGGRYDNLVRELGGPDLPAVGFACGLERLILALKETGAGQEHSRTIQVYLVTTEDSLQEKAMKYLQSVRNLGYSADMDYQHRSMKAQMKTAGKLGAKYVLILDGVGENVTVRNMQASEQTDIPFEDFLSLIEEDVNMKKQVE